MFLTSLAFIGGGSAAAALTVDRLQTIRREEIVAAAADPAWLKLLHYAQPAFGLGVAASDVLTANFFLAENGKTDPVAELDRTMEAMLAPVGSNPDEHAQCRYPARFIWLKNNIWAGQKINEVACPAFKTWLGKEPITGASFVFVSGHLENPSSFYGHLMLRLNTAWSDRPDSEQLLGRALNHGAIYPDNENGIAYIFNGLTGGYPATFSEISFFNHEHEWTEEELRDAWEYELDLDSDQLELLVAHTWEMRSAMVPYFFLKQNCGFRIAEMVSVVLDGSLLPDDKPWSMPVDVLDAAKAAMNGDRPLVRTSRILPSRQTTFRERYQALEDREKAIVRQSIELQRSNIDSEVADISVARQSAVIETLIDYYNMDQSRGGLTDAAREARNGLLVSRMQRPAGASPVEYDRDDPNEGNKTSLLQVSAVSNSERGDLLQLRLRGAYNDFLTRSPGSLPYSELSLGDIRVDLGEDGLVLRSAEVIRITTLSLSETGLPDDGGLAWRMRFGAEQDRLACDDCLVGYLEGGIGKATEFDGGFVAYGLLGGRAVAPDRDDGVVQLGATAGLITDPAQPIRASLEAGAWHDLDGDGRTRTFLQGEVRFGTASHWDTSLSARYEEVENSDALEVKASLSFYW